MSRHARPKELIFGIGVLALVSGAMIARDAAAAGGAIVTVLFDETTNNGRLRVVSRYYEGTDQAVVTGTYVSPTGDVVTVSCEDTAAECVAIWPSGVSLVSRPVSNEQVAIELFSGSTLVWSGVVDPSGSFVQGNADAFRALMTTMGQENASVVSHFAAFVEDEQVLVPDGIQCYALGECFKQRVSCGTAVIGFIASYPWLFTFAAVITCPLAVGAHAAAVVGLFTSCF